MKGRVTAIQQHGVTGGDAAAEKRIDFSYDADGQYATTTRYADLAGTELVATATYSFDDAYQLVGLTYTKGTTTLASYNYTFDAAGNMTSMTTVDGTTNYTSDATGQLTAAGSDTYAYDSNGNRTTANGSTYVTGVNNELLDDGTYTYTYDAEGNRLTKTDKATGAETDYTWDYRDRLSSVTFKDGSGTVTETVYYQYDAFNHLVGETVSVPGQAAQETVWVYDRGQIVSQFDGTGTLTANNLSHRYLWNPQAVDQLFADEQLSPLPPGEGQGEGYDLTTPGNVLWALTDHENSVRDLATYDPGTDVTTIANHRVYDAYGNLTSQTNAALDSLFGYTGRQFDQVTGLQNNLNRWYDPAVGRWLSEDPLSFGGGDSNLYRYVGKNPIMYVDATGLQNQRPCPGQPPLVPVKPPPAEPPLVPVPPPAEPPLVPVPPPPPENPPGWIPPENMFPESPQAPPSFPPTFGSGSSGWGGPPIISWPQAPPSPPDWWPPCLPWNPQPPAESWPGHGLPPLMDNPNLPGGPSIPGGSWIPLQPILPPGWNGSGGFMPPNPLNPSAPWGGGIIIIHPY